MVSFSGLRGGNGNFTILDHGNGIDPAPFMRQRRVALGQPRAANQTDGFAHRA